MCAVSAMLARDSSISTAGATSFTRAMLPRPSCCWCPGRLLLYRKEPLFTPREGICSKLQDIPICSIPPYLLLFVRFAVLWAARSLRGGAPFLSFSCAIPSSLLDSLGSVRLPLFVFSQVLYSVEDEGGGGGEDVPPLLLSISLPTFS